MKKHTNIQENVERCEYIPREVCDGNDYMDSQVDHALQVLALLSGDS